MIFLILVVGLFGVSLADVISQCQSMPDFPDFDIHKFTGIWYQQAKYFDPMVAGVKCITSEYAFDHGQGTVKNSGLNGTTNAVVALGATLKVPDPASPSRFKLTFPTKPEVPPANYWIVSTDYNNYGIVFACNKVRDVFRTRVWLLTRERNAPQKQKTQLTEIAQALNIETTSLLWTVQTGCDDDKPSCEEAKLKRDCNVN